MFLLLNCGVGGDAVDGVQGVGDLGLVGGQSVGAVGPAVSRGHGQRANLRQQIVDRAQGAVGRLHHGYRLRRVADGGLQARDLVELLFRNHQPRWVVRARVDCGPGGQLLHRLIHHALRVVQGVFGDERRNIVDS